MLRACIKLSVEDQPKNVSHVLEFSDGTSLQTLVNMGIKKAKWTDKRFALVMAKAFDPAMNLYVEIASSADTILVEHMQRFEILLKEEVSNWKL